MKRFSLLILLKLIALSGVSQQQHLEIGAKLGFKDEFHFKPNFDLNSRYTEIHYFDAYFFGRVSKRRFGNEFGFGLEKASDYFVRYADKSTQFGYVNLNRIQLDVGQYYYLIKTPLRKWDIQLGLRNYFGFNDRIWIPHGMDLKSWKLSGRIATNYTYKTLMFGVFYEHDFRSDYIQFDRAIVFGLNIGVIY